MGNFIDKKGKGDVALELFLIDVDLRVDIVARNEVRIEE